MTEPRIKAGIWVKMALRLGQADGQFAAVLKRGDEDAGGVLAVLRMPRGLSVLSQIRTNDGEAAWLRATGPDPVSQEAVDAYVARQVKFDPDLWVLEFETRNELPPFDGKIV
jgi:hypothetical protein